MLSIYQMDISRTTFLLKAYLRTRLGKVSICFFNDNVFKCCSRIGIRVQISMSRSSLCFGSSIQVWLWIKLVQMSTMSIFILNKNGQDLTCADFRTKSHSLLSVYFYVKIQLVLQIFHRFFGFGSSLHKFTVSISQSNKNGRDLLTCADVSGKRQCFQFISCKPASSFGCWLLVVVLCFQIQCFHLLGRALREGVLQIEKFVMHIIRTPELWERLSEQEQGYAQRWIHQKMPTQMLSMYPSGF